MNRLRSVGWVLAALVAAQAATAAELRFVHPSPEGVAGYRLRAVLEASPLAVEDYAFTMDLGPIAARANQVVRVPLPLAIGPGVIWRVALAAYDAQGRQSSYSNEVLVAARGLRGPFDGVAEDGDGSGIAGDAPCAPGQSEGCDDNCPTTPNGPELGTCLGGDPARIGRVCTSHAECGVPGYCSMQQEDRDGDGVGDVCDNCVAVPNPDQEDHDLDGFGSVCDADAGGRPSPSGLACAGGAPCAAGICPFATGDADGDGIGDECDVCMYVPDVHQWDADRDGIGNACDVDYDNDGRVTSVDAALFLRAVGAREGSPLYDARFDHDMNGVIDQADAEIRNRQGLTQGVSGLSCAGRIPCP